MRWPWRQAATGAGPPRGDGAAGGGDAAGQGAAPARRQPPRLADVLAEVEAVRSDVRRLGARAVREEAAREAETAGLQRLSGQVAALREDVVRIAERLEEGPERVAAERSRIVAAFLPVGDALFEAFRGAAPADDDLADSFRRLHAQFVRAVQACGAEVVPSAGAPFDPRVHRAVSRVEAPGREGAVVGVDRWGYVLDGQVLRLADVVVGAPPVGRVAGGPAERAAESGASRSEP